MSVDWDKLIESHFDNKKSNSLKILSETVREVMEEMKDLRTPLNERISRSVSINHTGIPEIPLTELGWNKLETEEGTEVTGDQRALLENYLNNIAPGGDLAAKIKSLDSFYESGFNQIESEKTTEMISKTLSFLVFYKTLTRIITNFNAASAGFTFEAFLATLLGGSQIKANTGTIADFKTGDNIPISLKLLNQTTNIEGSYTNLIDGLDEFDRMVYIVARKSKDESGSEEGIAIEQFTFTKDNFIDALSLSARGGRTKGADLFRISGLTTEQSITLLKGGTIRTKEGPVALPDESWESKYNLLQLTAGYSDRVRRKREAAVAAAQSAEAAQDPSTDTQAQEELNEAIIEEWNMLLESKGGTQWHISPAQLKSYDFVDYKTLGSLPVSEKSILDVARMYMDRLNNELLELFTATKSLSENINKYFTADKRNRAIGSGEKAIKNSTQIQQAMTAQIASASDSDEIDN